MLWQVYPQFEVWELMFTSKSFDEFVEEQAAQAEELKAYNEIHWPKQHEFWLGELEKLYSKMERYLKSYIHAGKIKCQRNRIKICEPNVGSYDAEELTLKIGTNKVVARPIGMQVIGAMGRVDLIGPRGVIKIALLEKGAPTWGTITPESDLSDERRHELFFYESTIEKEGWYFTSPPPHITAIEFCKDSFQDAILEIAEG